MANDFRRVSPGMYQGPNGQIVRSQQRPVQRRAPSGTRGEIGPIGGLPPNLRGAGPMRSPYYDPSEQPPALSGGIGKPSGWRSGPNMPPPAPMGPPPPDQGMVGIGGFEQQQQQPYFGPPPRGFGDSFQGGQAGGGWQQPPMPPQGMPPQPMSPPSPQTQLPPGIMRRNPLIGKIQGAKGPAGILTQPPKGNVF